MTHAEHVRRHHRSRARRIGALNPRTCDACGGGICCMYGQHSEEDPRAPAGVWLLHPGCLPPPPKAP